MASLVFRWRLGAVTLARKDSGEAQEMTSLLTGQLYPERTATVGLCAVAVRPAPGLLHEVNRTAHLSALVA